VIISALLDDCGILSLSFFIFALAGLEFALGFMLIILFRSKNIALDLNIDMKIANDFKNSSSNKIYKKSIK